MSRQSHEEQRMFLEADEKFSTTRQYHSRMRECALQVLKLVLLTINVAVTLAVLFRLPAEQQCMCSDAEIEGTYSPARSLIEYHAQHVDLNPPHSPFAGPPRLEMDQAWSKLLHATAIVISEDEMRSMNRTSIKLKDGSGYAGYLEAYHMLHCVKRFKQALYPEYYNDLAANGDFAPGHLDHCIEVLRRGIMCNADLTINTYGIDASRRTGTFGRSPDHRKCVRWDSIQAWAESRALGPDYLEKLMIGEESESTGPMYH